MSVRLCDCVLEVCTWTSLSQSVTSQQEGSGFAPQSASPSQELFDFKIQHSLTQVLIVFFSCHKGLVLPSIVKTESDQSPFDLFPDSLQIKL